MTDSSDSYPKIFAIDEQNIAERINTKKLLIQLKHGKNITLTFNDPGHEISLRSYWGDDEMSIQDKVTTINIAPDACNVISLDVNLRNIKSHRGGQGG